MRGPRSNWKQQPKRYFWFTSASFMPKESNFRMNIRLKNLGLLETDETAPTLTLAAKAQKILSSLFYLDP